MNKLLKDAIADAKAVRETALANAKIALEEAFQPQLERMFSEKMKSEMMDEPEEGMIEPDSMVNPVGEDESEGGMAERMRELAGLNERGFEDEDDDDLFGDEYKDAELPDDEYDGRDDPDAFSGDDEDTGYGDEEFEEGIDADLEEIIRQLEEDEMGMGAPEDPDSTRTEGKYMEGDKKNYMEEDLDEEIDLDEVIAALREDEDFEEEEESSPMQEGSADAIATIGDIITQIYDAGATGNPRDNSVMNLWDALGTALAAAGVTAAGMNARQIGGTLKGIFTSKTNGTEKASATSQELEEAYSVIEHLREKINEVNLLNAKLLYVNKVFKKHSLSESQKLRVVESFDRATTVRETKLIYTTLSESLATKPATKNKVMEGFASSPVKKTQILTESNTIVSRFQKLAGINNQD